MKKSSRKGRKKSSRKSRKSLDLTLARTARTLARHLRRHPDEPRALFMSDLFAELCVGVAGAPNLPRADVALHDVADKASVAHVLCEMWRDFVRTKELTSARAEILARRLAPMSSVAAGLFILADEARALDCTEAAHHFDAALAARFAGFVARAPTLKIDRALLESLGLVIDANDAHVRYHEDGHLAVLERDKRKLTLASRPGSGTYCEEGKRGGYGFAVDERYSDGHARGVLFSPWHDGEPYAHQQPWLCWVSACAATVLR